VFISLYGKLNRFAKLRKWPFLIYELKPRMQSPSRALLTNEI